ncbi:dTDP-4-dehydrorhamnose 3,5-epimerase [Daejeonella sp.]|uniref:dTDP-4-dehydrorhamnose 3,5-epimerase n=2 Tax=Daejeonella sp. TaxID=2805397 RepID=UPI002B6240C7|nr:dTDP-4-dehydrorhamnose 3,5-epimerase [Daejeonella sp.]HQT58838.1 dTDP-4-dehydrorhamnose 3,5-epimerase [Daejeonella sp.]
MAINDVQVTDLKIIHNPAGDVYHILKAREQSYAGFGEAYFSSIAPGIIKPWKKHNRMTLNLVVIMGCIKFVIYDDREGSVSNGSFQEVILSPDLNYSRITVPPGLWMAFEGLGQIHSFLVNIADLDHDPEEVERVELDDIKYKWS